MAVEITALINTQARGPTGPAGSDASVTAANVQTALAADPSGARDAIGGFAVIDVRDYAGVVGNGSNDDTAGIQLAADAAVAANLPLYFGPVSVRYKITDYINIDGSIPEIFGTGMDDLSDSVIRQATATKGVFRYRVVSPAPSNQYTTFRDLRIEGSSNITTVANDSRGIWLESNGTVFFDEVNVERVYIRGFTAGFHASKWSNSYLKQATIEACYNGYVIADTNNNSNTFYNCFAAGCTNIGLQANGTGTTLNLIAFEGGGHSAGNGSKALVVTNGKVRWISGNLEDYSGLRATDAADTTPGVVEVGINGQLFIEDVVFSAGGHPNGVPIVFRQYNAGGNVTRCQMLSYTAGLPLAKAYRTYSHLLRYQKPNSAGGEGIWIYADHTFTGTPAKLREISATLYHPSDIPAASQSRAGEEFATYDDGGSTPERRYVVAKTAAGTWVNVPLTPTLTDNTWIGAQSFTGLPTYADNDAALIDGLPGDRMYRTPAGALMVVKSFTPADLSGLKGWWAAADGGPKKTGGTAAADGETVSSWTDLSGNGKTLARAESTCIFDADGGPGGTHPAVLMGGASLSVAWGESLTDPWIIIVVKHDSDTGMLIDSEASGRVYASKYASALLSMSAGSIVNGLTVPNGAWGIQLIQWGTTGRYSWSNSTDTAVNSGANTMENLVIGRDYTNSSDLSFHVTEIIAGSGDLSDTDASKIKLYLASKYGITLA